MIVPIEMIIAALLCRHFGIDHDDSVLLCAGAVIADVAVQIRKGLAGR